MQVTTIGLDIAKNVFQVHGIDANEKVVVQEATSAQPRDSVFRGSAAEPGRDGGVCHRALLGARADQARPRGASDAGEGREGLRQAQQERRRRRRGDLRGGSAPDDALCADQVGRAARSVDAAPHARSADASAHPDASTPCERTWPSSASLLLRATPGSRNCSQSCPTIRTRVPADRCAGERHRAGGAARGRADGDRGDRKADQDAASLERGEPAG